MNTSNRYAAFAFSFNDLQVANDFPLKPASI